MKRNTRLLTILLLLMLVLSLFAGCQKIMVFFGANVGPGIKVIVRIPEELANGEEGVIIIQATDQNGDSLTIRWFVNDVPQDAFNNLEEFSLQESPAAQTVYRIKVVVSDGKESVSKTFLVTVLQPGQETFGVTLYGETPWANDTLQTLSASVSGATPGAVLLYQWFVNNTLQEATGSTFSFSKAPTAQTVYSVRVVVTEGERTAEDDLAITVLAPGVSNPTVTVGTYYSPNATQVTVSNNWYGEELYAYPSTDFGYNTTMISWYVDDALVQGPLSYSNWGDYLYLYSTDLPTTTEETTYVIRVVAVDGSTQAEDTLDFIVEAPPVESPSITPGGTSSSYAADVSIGTEITIETTTVGATIYYTVDGSDPSTSTTRILYEGPFEIPSGASQIKAYAVKTGMADSSVITRYYDWVVAQPDITTDVAPDVPPLSWFVSQPIEVTLTPVNPGSQIYYVVNTSSYTTVYDTDTLYTGPITIDPADHGDAATIYLHTRAYLDGWTDSGTAHNALRYTGVLQNLRFQDYYYSYSDLLPPGPYPGPITVFIYSPDTYDDIYYTTNGSVPDPEDTTNTFLYVSGSSGGIDINETTTIRAVATREYWGNSEILSGTFEIGPVIDATITTQLPLSIDHTSVEFTEDVQERWYAVTITEEGTYFLGFLDSQYGETDVDTANGEVNVYESDGVTRAGGLTTAITSIYPAFGVRTLQLPPGTYLLKVSAVSGSTGFCRIRLY